MLQAEFNVLNEIFKQHSEPYTQRQLAQRVNLSLGKTNQIITKLKKDGSIDERGQVTSKGIEALEPYRVTNAVIMAAGMSTRFAPLSYEKPKGLMLVKGERLIERQIKQLQEVGITDITLVVGYMKEKMFYLEDKFGVKIVVNSDYYRYNNSSSLHLVMNQLKHTYICSSDNYFVENPYETYVYQSYYSCVYGEGKTDEYCVKTDKNDRIVAVEVGGEDAWYMLGHVFFDRHFSQHFVEILAVEFEKAITKEELWEDLYIRYIDELDMYIRRYSTNLVKEFDSLEDLREFDDQYLNNSNSDILKNICSILNCQESDIHEIKPIKSGLTNVSFSFEVKGIAYVYRHPGAKTEQFINRKSEAASMEIAKRLKLDDTLIYIDPVKGWKLSYFIKDARTLDYRNPMDVKQALSMMRTLHQSGEKTEYHFDLWESVDEFIQELSDKERMNFEEVDQLLEMMSELRRAMKGDRSKEVLCHRDCYDPNFLIDSNGKFYLIDWEYSGMADPACDLGTFIACSDYNLEEGLQCIKDYFNQDVSDEEFRHYIGYVAISSFYWFLWGLHQESVGKLVGEYLYIWYKYTKTYGKKALELYQNIEKELER